MGERSVKGAVPPPKRIISLKNGSLKEAEDKDDD